MCYNGTRSFGISVFLQGVYQVSDTQNRLTVEKKEGGKGKEVRCRVNETWKVLALTAKGCQ